jgi:uncharacterized protein YjiS (DUF1127 family)
MSYSQVLALSAHPLPPLSRLLVTLALTVATWELRSRTRKHLIDLPDHMVRDIGLNPNDVTCEAEKPFWRA